MKIRILSSFAWVSICLQGMAFAGQVSLNPGESITIGSTVVSCGSTSEPQLPLCRIEPMGGPYCIYKDNALQQCFKTLYEAQNTLNQWKYSGICRY